MSDVQLNEAFLAKIAGWEAVKAARQLLAGGKVLSSNYTPPILKGVVQEGTITYRSGLVLKSGIDLENLCTCRASRQWGTICAHSVAVGLHHLKPSEPEPVESAPKMSVSAPVAQAKRESQRLRRARTGEPSAEPLQIHVILPQNFVESAAKGRAMLVLEGKWSRGRLPLNLLPKQQPFILEPADERLLNAVEELAGEPPGMLAIATREFVELLPALADHPRITLGKSTPLRIVRQPWVPPLRATLEPNGEIMLQLDAQSAIGNRQSPIFDGWIFSQNTLQPLGLTKPFDAVLSNPVRIDRAQVPAFLNNDYPRLSASGSIEANFKLDDFVVAAQSPEIILNLTGGLAQLGAQLQFKYGSRFIPAGSANTGEAWMPDPHDVKRYALRDFATEQASLARLIRAGFGPDAQGRLQLNGNDRVLNFFARDYPRLQKEWRVTMEERLQRSTNEKVERIEPRFEITSSGIQWFDFGVSFASNSGEQFSATDIQRLILSGQSHTRLRNGKIAVIDTGSVEELNQFLLDASPSQQQGKYRLSNAQAGFLESTLDQQGWQA